MRTTNPFALTAKPMRHFWPAGALGSVLVTEPLDGCVSSVSGLTGAHCSPAT